MKLDWKRTAARVDELSLRERGILFVAVTLVLVVLAHALAIDPLLRTQKSLIERVKQNQSQLNSVRSQMEKLLQEQVTASTSPEHAAVRELEKRIAAAEKAFATRQQAFVAPEKLPALLQEMLGRNRQLRLESLRLLPGAPAAIAAAPATPASAPKRPAVAPSDALTPPAPGLYRHGVELTLKGSYFDLMQYLTDLEKLPWRLLWVQAELQVEQYPEVKLTLVVQTLSAQSSLLAI